MSQDNEAIFRQWTEQVWCRGNEVLIEELLDPGAVAHFPHIVRDKPIVGVDEYKQFVRYVRRMFRDIGVVVEQIASDDDKVVSYCTFSGFPVDAEEPGLKRVSGLCQMIIRDGRIVQTWSNVDLFGDVTDPETDDVLQHQT